MKNQYLQLVNFEQAKRLEIAGFNWETDKLYCKPFQNRPEYLIPNDSGIIEHYLRYAPTVALALKWMRDVKQVLYEQSRSEDAGDDPEYYFVVTISYQKFVHTGNFPTYEQAESALLDELLTLIEK